MKYLFLFLALSLTTLDAQSNYEQGMQKALDLMKAEKLEEASNLFQRIASAERDNWLPAYYVTQIAIMKNWIDFENREEANLKANGDVAQEYINAIRTIDNDSPYADHLQAQLYTVWVAHDGMKYGMKYAGTISTLYEKMTAAAPDNPIFLAAKAEWDMGSARYFGTSIAPYCDELQRAITLFATFKPETAFHPSYGLERAKETAAACNND